MLRYYGKIEVNCLPSTILLDSLLEITIKGAGMVKIYYICEYCERVFNEVEVEGEEGSVQVKGICDECGLEMGIISPSSVNQHYYS